MTEWIEQGLRDLINVRQPNGVDIYQEVSYEALEPLKCKIQQKSKIVSIINGSEKQSHYTVVCLQELSIGQQLEIEGDWKTIISVEKQTSHWDDVTTWRAFV